MVLKFLFDKENCRKLLEGTVVGIGMGLLGHVLSVSMERSSNVHVKDHFFLARHEDMADEYQKLYNLLHLHDGDNFDQDSDDQIRNWLNLLAGIDEMIEEDRPFPFHLTYTTNEIKTAVLSWLERLVQRDFEILGLHVEICEHASNLSDIVTDISNNVQHEINARVHESNVFDPVETQVPAMWEHAFFEEMEK